MFFFIVKLEFYNRFYSKLKFKINSYTEYKVEESVFSNNNDQMACKKLKKTRQSYKNLEDMKINVNFYRTFLLSMSRLLGLPLRHFLPASVPQFS